MQPLELSVFHKGVELRCRRNLADANGLVASVGIPLQAAPKWLTVNKVKIVPKLVNELK